MRARQELERLAPPSGEPTLQPRIDELRQSLAAILSKGGTDQLPQRDHAEAALHSAQAELQKARDEERIAREAVDGRAQTVAETSAWKCARWKTP